MPAEAHHLPSVERRRARQIMLATALYFHDRARWPIVWELRRFRRALGGGLVAMAWTDPGLHQVIPYVAIDPRGRRLTDLAGMPTHFIASKGGRNWYIVAGGVRSWPDTIHELHGRLFGHLAFWQPALPRLDGSVIDPDPGRRTARTAIRFLDGHVRSGLQPLEGRFGREITAWPRRTIARSGRRTPIGRAAWTLVRALRSRDEIPTAAVELAETLEREGHLDLARHAADLGYEVCALRGGPGAEAVLAARIAGRINRKSSNWREAMAWYARAVGLAQVIEDYPQLAYALEGRGTTLRTRGAIPRARETYAAALRIASKADDARALASGHHSLMILERESGRVGDALRHGWTAVEQYPDEQDRLYALVDLGDTLAAAGRVDAATDALEVVAARSEWPDPRAFALHRLAHLAACRGDVGRLRAIESDPDVRRGTSDAVHVECLLWIARARAELGDAWRARGGYRDVIAFADERGLSQALFEAEQEMEGLGVTSPLPTPHVEVPEVERGLRELRQALV